MRITMLKQTLDDLYETDGIEACILYRLDGQPIAVRTPRDRGIIEVMFWLEKQINSVLRNINAEGFTAITFDFKNHQIMIIPSSKSTILVTLISREVHKQLISIEISRAISQINKCIS